jgi:hypothetical protein
MGKPEGALEKLYNEHKIHDISVWIDAGIDLNAVKEIKIGHRKFWFWNELTLDGISTQVHVT